MRSAVANTTVASSFRRYAGRRLHPRMHLYQIHSPRGLNVNQRINNTSNKCM